MRPDLVAVRMAQRKNLVSVFGSPLLVSPRLSTASPAKGPSGDRMNRLLGAPLGRRSSSATTDTLDERRPRFMPARSSSACAFKSLSAARYMRIVHSRGASTFRAKAVGMSEILAEILVRPAPKLAPDRILTGG